MVYFFRFDNKYSLWYNLLMKTLVDTSVWDYKVDKKDLQDPKVLLWYLNRKTKMADWRGLNKKMLLQNVDKLDISPYRKKAIKIFFGDE